MEGGGKAVERKREVLRYVVGGQGGREGGRGGGEEGAAMAEEHFVELLQYMTLRWAVEQGGGGGCLGNLIITNLIILDRKAVVELLLGPSAEELWDYLRCVYLYSPSSLPSPLFPSFIVPYTQLTFLPSLPFPSSPSLSLPLPP